RPGLAGVDPVPRPVHVEELRAGDLREPDRRDVARLGAERPVHLLVHALRLDGDLGEVGLALQRALALGALGGPAGVVARPAGGRSRATSTNSSGADRASETMP